MLAIPQTSWEDAEGPLTEAANRLARASPQRMEGPSRSNMNLVPEVLVLQRIPRGRRSQTFLAFSGRISCPFFARKNAFESNLKRTANIRYQKSDRESSWSASTDCLPAESIATFAAKLRQLELQPLLFSPLFTSNSFFALDKGNAGVPLHVHGCGQNAGFHICRHGLRSQADDSRQPWQPFMLFHEEFCHSSLTFK